MQKVARYISFSSGLVRPMFAKTVEEQMKEAVSRCDNMNQEANLLDENYKVLAEVKFTPGAMNGYAVYKPE